MKESYYQLLERLKHKKLMKLTLNQKPTPKKRHRFSRKSDRFYNPSFSDEEKTRWEMIHQIHEKPVFRPSTASFDVEMYFDVPFPRSFNHGPENKNLKIPHVSKPDVDNLVKFYMDVMKRLIYHDDCQVWSLYAEKRLAPNPQVEILIEETLREETILHTKIPQNLFNRLNKYLNTTPQKTLKQTVHQALEDFLNKRDN